jgi:hypothetical protein
MRPGLGLLVARHRSAYPKAALRVTQKKTGAVRSRSVICVCARLLSGDKWRLAEFQRDTINRLSGYAL